jgi:hypothetical protein
MLSAFPGRLTRIANGILGFVIAAGLTSHPAARSKARAHAALGAWISIEADIELGSQPQGP